MSTCAKCIYNSQRDVGNATFSRAVEDAVIGYEDEACTSCSSNVKEAFGSAEVGAAERSIAKAGCDSYRLN
jgi:hypothetical protein